MPIILRTRYKYNRVGRMSADDGMEPDEWLAMMLNKYNFSGAQYILSYPSARGLWDRIRHYNLVEVRMYRRDEPYASIWMTESQYSELDQIIALLNSD